MLSAVQIILLVFFYVAPEVDALRCVHCIPKDKEGTCALGICEINPKTETCHVLKIYKSETYTENTLEYVATDCKKKEDAKCDTRGKMPSKNVYYEHVCCENKDLCNGNL